MAIPVIDIFAGPGGLGEGFSSLLDENGRRVFKLALSIEKEFYAHQTLTLRSFYRHFDVNKVPEEYYDFVKGKITLPQLYKAFPAAFRAASQEAWLTELGNNKTSASNADVDIRIRQALKGESNWLLVGGPPCQAYSIVGRSRRREKILDGIKDHRVELYKQYLRILAIHNPTVFVMENVKGILSAETHDNPIFSKILEDLSDPVRAYKSEFGRTNFELNCPGYKIYSLVCSPSAFDTSGNPEYSQKDFVIKAEKYGIPQTRHRVILLGIRKGIEFIPSTLDEKNPVSISKVLSGLPKIRSSVSKIDDSKNAWRNAIQSILKRGVLSGVESKIKEEIFKQVNSIQSVNIGIGSNYISYPKVSVDYRKDWYQDIRLEGVCNHLSRSHMESDLLRYLFASCFAKVKGVSPKLEDFPLSLLPKHENVKQAINDQKFVDRFRVQINNKPSKTITSHISKDGHYYIHPDPLQCRSFTVREAARIQTFPDNYFFCGPRTSQFIQVGNAVPPLLANNIAKIVNEIFLFSKKKKSSGRLKVCDT